MELATDRERIATLEAKEEISQKVVEDIKTSLESLNSKVGRIEMRMEKSMSFMGGIAFTFSLLGGVFAILAEYVLKKMGVYG